MPETVTRTTPLVVVDTEHQERERRVPCARCSGRTENTHAICDACINAGAPVRCHGVCSEVARSVHARLVVAG